MDKPIVCYGLTLYLNQSAINPRFFLTAYLGIRITQVFTLKLRVVSAAIKESA
jgi:hypothetical protein